MKKAFAAVLAICLAFAMSACVVHEGPVVRDKPYHHEGGDFYARIDQQQKRINEGIGSGELTRREADILQDNLNYIRNQYSRMKADGRLTRNEVVRLEKMLDQNSAMIYDKKHNAARRLY